jgi:RNA polymerase sigma factor (TIGR02999 family)
VADPTSSQITRILNGPDAPESAALRALVYDQLRKIAQQRMNEERREHTLQATALVHEAWIRLAGDTQVSWENRAHFFFAAAEAMRRILIEHARARGRRKRGGAGGGGRVRRVELDVLNLAVAADCEEILSVNEAVCRLEARDADLGRIVRLRFFAGLTEQEVALVLGVTDRTVRRDWALARALLQKDLDGEPIT